MAISPPPSPDLTALRGSFNTARAASGMTFDRLADASGLSRRTLLNIFSGSTTGDLKTWLILSRVWGVPLDDLMAPTWE